jgi:hypothetical protein
METEYALMCRTHFHRTMPRLQLLILSYYMTGESSLSHNLITRLVTRFKETATYTKCIRFHLFELRRDNPEAYIQPLRIIPLNGKTHLVRTCLFSFYIGYFDRSDINKIVHTIKY